MKISAPFFKLNKYKKNITSQFGEDGIIDYLIKTSKTKILKNCIEFGAHDGITNSNTYNLWKNHNYNCLLIEDNKERYDKLFEFVKSNQNVKAINQFVGFEKSNSLEKIIKDSDFFSSKEVGVLSIDIDSHDYKIFKNLTFSPQIIVIEFNNSIPGHIDYSDPDDELFLRCSAKAIQNLGYKKGYYTVACTVTNCLLIREDCFNKKAHPNLPVEYLLDYEAMKLNNDYLYNIVHSQSISSKPIFTKPVNKLDRIYFNISRFLMSKFGIRKEKFIHPNQSIRKKLNDSDLYF